MVAMQSLPMTTLPLTSDDLDELRELATHNPDALLAHARWCLHTPYALALKLVLGEAYFAALATVVLHADSAWLLPTHWVALSRTADLEQLLLAAVVNTCAQAGRPRMGALVSEEALPLYAQQGFVEHARMVRYAGGQAEEPVRTDVVPLEPQYTLGLLHLDRRATGEDRSAWLLEHLFLGQVLVQRGLVRGFLLPLLQDGLIVADGPETELELLRWKLGNEPGAWVRADAAVVREGLERWDYAPMEERVLVRRG